ncbi:MAG: ferredoxin, partial [Microcystis sp.]
IETCPVNCIHWVNYNNLQFLEEERKHQVIKQLGFPQIHKKFSPADLDL